MARPSPSVQRVVAVLDFFANHPGQSFTLTDIIRSLRLSRATCHALLNGLAEAGYLFRGSDKSYVLGPRLVAIGQQAQSHASPLQVAQAEMRRLADAYDVVCSAIFLEGTDIVVRERANSRSHLGDTVPRGTRLPLRLPFAGIFFAWSPPQQLERWLQQLRPPPARDQLQALAQGMAFARTQGFQVILHRPQRPSATLGSWPRFDTGADRPVSIVTQLRARSDYPLAGITAPVFQDEHSVAFVLALLGFNRPVSGAEILRAGAELRRACRRISTFTAGSPEGNAGRPVAHQSVRNSSAP